jgi:hypothetical protein
LVDLLTRLTAKRILQVTETNATPTGARMMTYKGFCRTVAEHGWTIADLRCEDAPPSAELLEVMDAIGLGRYEAYVLRFEKANSR